MHSAPCITQRVPTVRMSMCRECKVQASFIPALRTFAKIWKACRWCLVVGAPVWLPNLASVKMCGCAPTDVVTSWSHS